MSGILGDFGYLSDNTNSTDIKNFSGPTMTNQERAAQEQYSIGHSI
jgi:hypothetical protein